jgi:hypothetical protein
MLSIISNAMKSHNVIDNIDVIDNIECYEIA